MDHDTQLKHSDEAKSTQMKLKALEQS
jgi:hypothetical protein